MDRDLEEIRLELEAEARAKEMAAARAASPSGGRVVWCQWCACFEDDPRCTCPAEPKPCPGIEIEPGKHSGCTAAQTGAKDCPTCGPRVTCAHCGAIALEGEAEGWRCLTCHGATHQMVCPECQKDLKGEDRNPNP